MSDRGTGRTERQMKEAPVGAVFVWCNSDLYYPRALAKKLEREDLDVRPLSWLVPHNTMGREFSGLVIDHAAPSLTSEGREAFECARISGKQEQF